MKKLLIAGLLAICAACTENLPTNETSDPGAAGSVAANREALSSACLRSNGRNLVLHTAEQQTLETAMQFAYGFVNTSYCEPKINGYTNCWNGPIPHVNQALWTLQWEQGVYPTSQTSKLYYAPQNGHPTILYAELTCSCSSCNIVRFQ